MKPLSLYVDVPICAFRPNWSREYQDTYPFPPPSTVYGMLLSLAGVDWEEKSRFMGIRLALALQAEPERSRVFRKFRRVGQSNKNADPLADRRPDYQDLLLWMKLWVWLDDGKAKESLAGMVAAALNSSGRGSLRRYGALSLGESSHLVNEISVKPAQGHGQWLIRKEEGGPYLLPVWVSHPRDRTEVGRLVSFDISPEQPLSDPADDDTSRWVEIEPAKHD